MYWCLVIPLSVVVFLLYSAWPFAWLVRKNEQRIGKVKLSWDNVQGGVGVWFPNFSIRVFCLLFFLKELERAESCLARFFSWGGCGVSIYIYIPDSLLGRVQLLHTNCDILLYQFNSLWTAQMRIIDDAMMINWRYVVFITYGSLSPSVCPISPYPSMILLGPSTGRNCPECWPWVKSRNNAKSTLYVPSGWHKVAVFRLCNKSVCISSQSYYRGVRWAWLILFSWRSRCHDWARHRTTHDSKHQKMRTKLSLRAFLINKNIFMKIVSVDRRCCAIICANFN